MRSWTSDGISRARSGEGDRLLIPYGWKYDGLRRGAIWSHGAAGTYEWGPVERAIFDDLLVPAASTDSGGIRTWGSDAVTGPAGTVEGDRAWMVAQASAKADKALLLGGSMGGLTAILTALANPTKVAAVCVFIPAIDPEYVRLNDPAGGANTTAIQALYGVNPVPAAKQAYQRGADFRATGIPCQIWYSSNDPYTPVASTETFINAAGAEGRSMGAVGHTYDSVVTATAVQFLKQYR
jgi:hypothetical protein